MGRWHHDARNFLKSHRRELERLPFAVFALGPGKNTPEEFADRASSSTTRSGTSPRSKHGRSRSSAV